MRFGARVARLLLPLLWLAGCGGGSGLFTQYEYEEETYLSLDGSATVYVNSSVGALNALRGSTFDPSPGLRPDKATVTAFFTAPGVEVTRVTYSSRNGREYVHVRMSVDDVRRLGATKPFGWSTYSFTRDGNLMLYRQKVGATAPRGTAVGAPATAAGGGAATWKGDEIVAFRLHIPSKVPYHNAGPDNLRRGNILVWEQSLASRLEGAPVDIDARMETQSILYRTLFLFGGTILAVAATFAILLVWIRRKAARRRLDGGEPAPLRRP